MSLTYEFNSSIFSSSHNVLLALQPKTNCARTAITLIVQDCDQLSSSYENQNLRVSLAISLAVCEFRAASVVYPAVCDGLEDTNNTSECTQQLVSSPQWWTTYHGCYNSVKQICHMEEASRECERALKTHSSIISMQERLQAKMAEYADLVGSMSSHKNHVLDLWNETFDFVSETLNEMRAASDSLNQVYRQNFVQAEDHFKTLFDNLEDTKRQVESLGNAAEDAVSSLSKSTLAQQALVSEKLKNDASSLQKQLVLAHQDSTEAFESNLASSLASLVLSSDQMLLNHVAEVSQKLSNLMIDLEASQKRSLEMQDQLQQKVQAVEEDLEGFSETVKQGLEASQTLLKLVKSKVQLVNGLMSVFSRPVRSAVQLGSFIVMIRAAFIGGVYTSIGLVVGSVLGVFLMQAV